MDLSLQTMYALALRTVRYEKNNSLATANNAAQNGSQILTPATAGSTAINCTATLSALNGNTSNQYSLDISEEIRQHNAACSEVAEIGDTDTAQRMIAEATPAADAVADGRGKPILPYYVSLLCIIIKNIMAHN